MYSNLKIVVKVVGLDSEDSPKEIVYERVTNMHSLLLISPDTMNSIKNPKLYITITNHDIHEFLRIKGQDWLDWEVSNKSDEKKGSDTIISDNKDTKSIVNKKKGKHQNIKGKKLLRPTEKTKETLSESKDLNRKKNIDEMTEHEKKSFNENFRSQIASLMNKNDPIEKSSVEWYRFLQKRQQNKELEKFQQNIDYKISINVWENPYLVEGKITKDTIEASETRIYNLEIPKYRYEKDNLSKNPAYSSFVLD